MSSFIGNTRIRRTIHTHTRQYVHVHVTNIKTVELKQNMFVFLFQTPKHLNNQSQTNQSSIQPHTGIVRVNDRLNDCTIDWLTASLSETK